MKFLITIAFCIFTMPLVSFAELSPLPDSPPIPADNPMSEAKIELGKQLYFDPRVSKNGTVSCNSCHNVMAGGSDNRAVSAGIHGLTGPVSAPTVFNSAFNFVQFWDGRAPTLEDQALGPPQAAPEMGDQTFENDIIPRLKRIPGYVAAFQAVFGGEITKERFGKAIAAYERTLITPNSPFDQFLKGDALAISVQAKRGYQKFQEVNCTMCHNGAAIGGGMKMPFPMQDDELVESAYGYKTDDQVFFKVPTLRNIALTAPYFHNGKVLSLEEAVNVMARVQLGIELGQDEIEDIVAFLKTLTGEVPASARMMPTLPPSEGTVVIDADQLDI